MVGYNNGNDLVRRLVIVADFVILNAILWAYMAIANKWEPLFFDKATKITIFVANVSLLIGQYHYSTIIHERKVRYTMAAKRTLYLALTTCVIFFLSIRLLSDEGGLLLNGLVFTVTFYIALLVSRCLELNSLKHYRSMGYNTRTALFIGNDPAILDMYRALIEDPSAGYIVEGYYADIPIANAPTSLKKIGDMSDLCRVMDAKIDNTINGKPSNIDEVFCCLSHDFSNIIMRIMQFCDKNVIHFYYLPRRFGEYQWHLDPQVFMGKNVYSNHIEPLTSATNRAIKRTFDLCMSGIVCLCMLPFIPIIALCIKIQSPGPIFFKQSRTGLNGKTFECYKFRSMHVNKEADRAQATKDDPRKFAFGNFMRKTNLDEFPQFFNVLKGDMSIVGPRPHMIYHTETYGMLIDKYMVRHFSKPGITGWAQVTGYRGETKELWQMEERIKRDIWYVENWSFWLDIKIILLTAKSIIWPDKHAY